MCISLRQGKKRGNDKRAMKKIGICGSSGSGKGYVCSIFKEYGIAHIDTDLVYREKTVVPNSLCLKELVFAFGNEILNNDGTLNKSELAKIVFEGEGKDTKRELLNQITHKHIKIDTENIIAELEKQSIKAVLIDAPLLFESGFDKMCNFTICVTANDEIKLERIVERDRISKEKALARLVTQLSDSELRLLCDYEIKNDSSSDIQEQIALILKQENLIC